MPIDITQTLLPFLKSFSTGLIVFTMIIFGIIIYFNVKKKCGFFTTLYKCFNLSEYASLKDYSIGQSLGFYALLIILFLLVGSSLFFVALSISLPSLLTTELPEISITNGVVSLEQDPYIVENIFYASTLDFDYKTREEPLVLTKTQLVIRDRNNIEVQDLAGISFFNLSNIMPRLPKLLITFFVIGLIAVGFILFVYYLVYFLLLSLVLMLNNLFFKRNWYYSQYFNVALFSSIPILLIINVLFLFIPSTAFLPTIIQLILLSWLTWWLSAPKPTVEVSSIKFRKRQFQKPFRRRS